MHTLAYKIKLVLITGIHKLHHEFVCRIYSKTFTYSLIIMLGGHDVLTINYIVREFTF